LVPAYINKHNVTSDLIVIHESKINLIDAEHWNGIIKANIQYKFEIIYKMQ
jgi:hypothetical protein